MTTKYKKLRQMLRLPRKKKSNKSEQSFIAGIFSDKIIPTIDFTDELVVHELVVKNTLVDDGAIHLIENKI